MTTKIYNIIRILFIIITIAALVFAIQFNFTGCESKKTSPSDSPTQETLPTSATEASTEEATAEAATELLTAATEPATISAAEPTTTVSTEKPTEAKNSGTANKPSGSSGNSSSSNNKPSNNTTPTTKPSTGDVTPTTKPSGDTPAPTTDPHAGKTYHEAVYKTVHHDAVYENVWVVDQEAYSYEEPIYEKRGYTICHVCGAEFDTTYENGADSFTAHNKAHMLAGEGGNYHSEVRKVKVGSTTVNVPEEGHYEKQLVKAAYDEKVLVKEAGWY